MLEECLQAHQTVCCMHTHEACCQKLCVHTLHCPLSAAGWSAQQLQKARSRGGSAQGASSSARQQPVTVSINPARPAPTVVLPTPPRQPAPATYSLPDATGDALAAQDLEENPISSSSSSSNDRISSSGSSANPQQRPGSRAPVAARKGAGSSNGNWASSSSRSRSSSIPRVAGVVTQAPATTVKVYSGGQGMVNTISSQQPQQVTIISIMPTAGNVGAGAPQQTMQQQQQQQQQLLQPADTEVVILPAVDELQAGDLSGLPDGSAASEGLEGAAQDPDMLAPPAAPAPLRATRNSGSSSSSSSSSSGAVGSSSRRANQAKQLKKLQPLQQQLAGEQGVKDTG